VAFGCCRLTWRYGYMAGFGRIGMVPAWMNVRIRNLEDTVMLRWALFFLILALIAALFGFTGIAGAAAGIAKILFFVFLVLLVISAIAGALRGRPPV
jgi:uncharacterized membrane protein YtjA (UPF0391 family)